MHDNEAYVTEALSSGAAGYVLKQSNAADLVEAVHVVVTDRRYLSPMLSARALEAYIQFVQEAKESAMDPYESLTAREREVLHLAAAGHTNTEIAERLSINSRTVETYQAKMMRKLGLRTPTDLVRYAIQQGNLPM